MNMKNLVTISNVADIHSDVSKVKSVLKPYQPPVAERYSDTITCESGQAGQDSEVTGS